MTDYQNSQLKQVTLLQSEPSVMDDRQNIIKGRC